MTIDLTDNAPRISYTVSTSTTSFAVPFEFFDDADLVVVVGGTTKTLTTHYTVSGGNGATGTVTMTSGNEVSSGTVIIFRDIDFKRTTDFPTSGAFPIATLNTELDRNIALFDDLQDRIDRSVRLNDNDDAASMVLPLKASRKGTVLGFNATTGAAEAGPTIANVNSLADITTNINTVAGISSNVTTVAGISSNVTTVAGISSAVSSVAGVASLITSDFVSDLNTLATSAIVEDLNILATTDIVSDLNQLATSDFVSDLSSVEGIKANVTSVGNNIANVNTVATQLTSSSPTFTNTVTASAYTTSGGGTFFIGNTSFRQTGVTRTDGEIELDSSSTIKLRTNSGEVNLFDDDSYFGRISQDGNGELVISSGSSGGGGAPVTALTFSGANATFSGTINTTSTNKIQFGDSGTYIHQSADGVLDLVSDSEIEINATTIDMNGNLDVSGSATVGTDVTSASGNFVTSGSNIALEHSSGEHFFTATKDGGSAMYHDAYPVFSTSATNAGAVGTTNKNTQTLDTQSTFLEIGNSGAGGGTDTGTLVLSATSNANDERIGDIRFANAANADDDGTDADGRMVARIQTKSVTSDSNAGDDSGGTIVFSTKPEAGSIATALTLASDQSATFAGNVDLAGYINFSGTASSFANISQPRIFRSGSSSGSYPFDAFGHLVLQSRGDGSDRDIVFATGTGGANKSIVKSDGKVGLGTTSPSQNLHISSSDHTKALITGGTNKYAELQFENDAQKFAMGVQDDDKFFLYNSTGASQVLTVDTSSNVGIGTSNPGADLHVKGTMKIEGDASYFADTLAAVNSTAMAFNMSPSRASVTKSIAMGAIGSINTHTGLQAYDSSDNSANNFSINPLGGNVGIGTSSPAQVLDIQSSSTLSTRIFATGNNTRAQLLTQAHTSGGDDVNMVLGSFGDSTRGEISMNTNHPLRFYTNNDPNKGVELETDGDLNIKDGNLVIGTSGHGIDFSVTADGNTVGSELLDDYEEGTWSPALAGGTGFSATQSNSGTYTKIGRLVFVQVVMNISSYSQGASTHPFISGLPFAPDGGNAISTFGYGNSYNTTHMFTVSDVTGAALSGSNFYISRGGQSGTGNVFVQRDEIQDGRVNMAFVYYT